MQLNQLRSIQSPVCSMMPLRALLRCVNTLFILIFFDYNCKVKTIFVLKKF
jgi:hypothetical protein